MEGTSPMPPSGEHGCIGIVDSCGGCMQAYWHAYSMYSALNTPSCRVCVHKTQGALRRDLVTRKRMWTLFSLSKGRNHFLPSRQTRYQRLRMQHFKAPLSQQQRMPRLHRWLRINHILPSSPYTLLSLSLCRAVPQHSLT